MKKVLLAGFLYIGFLWISSDFASADFASNSDIGEIAEKITVRIDTNDVNDGGSGVLVKKEGNTYTVLTNCHVVRNSKKYSIRVYINGANNNSKVYSVNASQKNCLSGADLATLKFNSSENITIANLGDFNGVRTSTKIYISGWIIGGGSAYCSNGARCYRTMNTEVQGFVPKPLDGYSFTHGGNQSRPGMSGGPILNEQGDLIGINGQAYKDKNTGSPDNAGISINTYKRISSIKTPSKSPAVVTASPKKNQQASIRASNNNSIPKPIDKNPQVVATSSITFDLKYNLDTGNSGNYIPGITISPDRQYVVIGGDNGSVKIWRISDGKLIRTLRTGTDSTAQIESVAVSPDGQKVVTGSDSVVRIWSFSDGTLLQKLEGHLDYVKSIAISSDGQNIVSGSKDGTTKIWRLSDGQLLHTLEHDEPKGAWVHSIISSDGQNIVSHGIHSINVWRLSDGQLLRTMRRGDIIYRNVAISSDSTTIAASGSHIRSINGNGVLDIYRLSDGKLMKTLINNPNNEFDAVLISPDSHNLIVGQGDIQLRRLPDGKILQILKGHRNDVRALAISLDGQILVSGSRDKTVKIWQRRMK